MTMYPPHVPAAHRFCLTTDNRQAQKGTPSPVPHGKNLTQLFTMGRVQPRSLGNRGGTWYFLASSFPLYPRNRCITEPFAPVLHRNRYVSGPAYLPHAPESVRHATVLQREWCIAVRNCLRTCPCPCHGNGTLCNPLNPRNLLQPFEHVGLVGKRCAMETEESEGAKSVSH